MRTEKLFTVIGMLFVGCITESFAAPSIRSVETSGNNVATTSRAGSLRSGSLKTSTGSVSSNVSVSSSDVAGETRMATLPGGMPKVSKPKLPSSGYASVDLSDIEARLDDLQTNKANVDDLDNFATRTELSGKADLSDLEDYATKDELEDKADSSALTDLATKAELNAKADISRVYDKETVDAKLDGLGAVDADTVSSIVDGKLSPYSTTTQMNTAITSATSGLATTSALNTGLAGKADASALSSYLTSANAANTYATKSQLDNKITRPTSTGTAGQILKLASDGSTTWGDNVNVQLTTFSGDNKLYYCAKSNGICDTANAGDNWTGVDIGPLKGEAGKTAWLRKYNGNVQVCYKDTECDTTDNWTNIVALSDIKGESGNDGKAVEIQKVDDAIKWRYSGDSTWQSIVALSELKGQDGKDACQNFSVERDTSYAGTDGTRYNLFCND